MEACVYGCMERWVDVRMGRGCMDGSTLFVRRVEGRSEVEPLAPVRACPEFGLGGTLPCMGTRMVIGWVSALLAVDILLACTDVVSYRCACVRMICIRNNNMHTHPRSSTPTYLYSHHASHPLPTSVPWHSLEVVFWSCVGW